MTTSFFRSALWLACGLMLAAGPASADSFPTKPVNLMVPYPAGGPSDATARIFTVPLGKALGQQVIVENLLAQRFAQRHGEDARGGVRGAAGRVGNHQVHGLGGKAVGAGRARGQHQPAGEPERGTEERGRQIMSPTWEAGSCGRMRVNARSEAVERPMHCCLH